ncbi:MAG TPA: hypothetical protein VNM92_02285 [Thermoanaerobaculia bacterium]|nr:hypothetical protein [Thermoanaerobaculia bacterium]
MRVNEVSSPPDKRGHLPLGMETPPQAHEREIGLILPGACAIYNLIFRESLSSRLPEILRSSVSFKLIYANQPHS